MNPPIRMPRGLLVSDYVNSGVKIATFIEFGVILS